MNKRYLILLLVLPYLSVFGQTYDPLIRPNFYWDVLHVDVSEICQLRGGNRYFFQGDTIIEGIQYNIIRTYPIKQIDGGPFCPPFFVDDNLSSIDPIFIREDTSTFQVFIYNKDIQSEEIFYDFTLSPGDTLQSSYAGQGSTIIVDSTGVVELFNGALRRIFYLDNGEYYIESIGGSQGLQFPLVQGIGFSENPVCYTANDAQIWGDDCQIIVGADIPENSGQSVSVFPNPIVDGIICVKMEPYYKSSFILFDLAGRIQFSEVLNSEVNFLDVPNLRAGTYIYHLYNNRQTVSNKLIISGN